MRSLLLLLLPAVLVARDVRLLRIDAPEGAPSRLFVVRGESASAMDLPRLLPSVSRLQVGPEAARLHLALEKPSRERPLPSDAPAVDLPAGTDDLLVVLVPKEGPGVLSVHALPVAVPDDPARIGSFLWMNFSDRTLLVRFGAALTPVPPAQGRAVLPPVAPGAAFPVHVDLAPRREGEDVQPMVRATWMRHESGRQLMFVLPDAEREVPRIVSVPDIASPSSTKPAGSGPGGAAPPPPR